jgi:peptidoglycan-associated lipoprotein
LNVNASLKSLLTAAASAVLIVGCTEGVMPDAGTERTPAEVVDKSQTQGSQTGSSGASTSALPSAPAGWQGDPLDDPDGMLAKRIVYFDFDSASMRAEGREILEAHAQYLAEQPNASVTLEGHADERGTREYNIALGERRGQAVRRLLTLLGVSDGQVRTVSFGEERPAVFGHDESSWWQNRRVELNYER